MVALPFPFRCCFPLTRVLSQLEAEAVAGHRSWKTPEEGVGTEDGFHIFSFAEVLVKESDEEWNHLTTQRTYGYFIWKASVRLANRSRSRGRTD